MSPLRSIAIALVCTVVAVAVAAPGYAETRKQKKKEAAAAASAKMPARYHDPSLFPKGPVYWGDTYMGDDPDPFIRSQLLRDTGRFGGDNN